MKKLVFAAFAAFVMVSVSNVFAGSSKAELGLNMPVDSTVVDTADTVGAPAEGRQNSRQLLKKWQCSATQPTRLTLQHTSSRA